LRTLPPFPEDLIIIQNAYAVYTSFPSNKPYVGILIRRPGGGLVSVIWGKVEFEKGENVKEKGKKRKDE
jgi:hypothetical protein